MGRVATSRRSSDLPALVFKGFDREVGPTSPMPSSVSIAPIRSGVVATDPIELDHGERAAMGENGQVKLFSPEFWADPFPFFARLRAEEPVHRATPAAPDPDLAGDPLRGRPGAPEGRAVRQGPDHRHDPGAAPQDALGAADVPPAGAEHARPRPARPHAAAGAGPQGVHAPAGRADAGAGPDPRRRVARRRRATGRDGPDPRLRPAAADDPHHRNPRRADPRTGRGSTGGRR